MFDVILAVPPIYVIIFFFIFGAMWGSFANVFILRWPEGESVVSPRSRCGSCKKPIAWYDNIPILTWFILRGKCRACGAKFSGRYAFVEFLMGSLFALAFWKLGWSWTFAESLPFIFALVTASFIDLDHFLLPDIFTLSGIVIGLTGAALNPDRNFWDAVIGVFFGYGFLWSLAYFYFLLRKEDGMGGGDMKLLAWIGAVLGWQNIPFVILTSSILGSIGGLIVAARDKTGMKAVIPFGPYLAIAALLILFAGRWLSESYFNWLFPPV